VLANRNRMIKTKRGQLRYHLRQIASSSYFPNHLYSSPWISHILWIYSGMRLIWRRYMDCGFNGTITKWSDLPSYFFRSHYFPCERKFYEFTMVTPFSKKLLLRTFQQWHLMFRSLQYEWMYKMMRCFILLSRCKLGLRSSGMLRSVDW
jgi:hypothetical protein